MSTVAQTATLAHGYTMADIDGCTRSAMNISYRSWMLEWNDRWETAWDGIVVHLYRADAAPTRHELVTAGLNALGAMADAYWHHHGINPRTREMGANVARFWLAPVGGQLADFTDSIAERLALPQVLAVLTDLEYEAIAALAAHGSNTAAAAALGITTKTFSARVNAARRRFVETWLDHETPPRAADLTQTCRAGHPRDDENGYVINGGRHWRCRTCGRARDRKRKALNATDETREKARLAARARRGAVI